MSNLSEVESIQFRKTYLIDRLKKYGIHLLQGDINAFMTRALAFVTSRTARLFMPVVKTAFQLMKQPLPRILPANDLHFLKAWSSYVPRRYPKRVVCFRVEDRGPEYDRDPSMGWEACVIGGVQVHVVPGGHVDMMTAPTVHVIADMLATELDSGSNHEKDSLARTS